MRNKTLLFGVSLLALLSMLSVAVGVFAHNAQAHGLTAVHAHTALATGGNCTKWYGVQAQNPSPQGNTLYDVAAVSTTNIWAVGWYSNQSVAAGEATLIEHWNGSAWSVVASPSPGSVSNLLQKVAVVSANDIWAVGEYQNSGGQYQTLTEHWDGTSWTVIPSPNATGANSQMDDYLNGVAAISSNDVWAVGHYASIDPLLEHWDGTKWTIVSTPMLGSVQTILTSVAAIATNDVWITGYYENSSNGDIIEPLFEHWNGSSWSTDSVTNTGWGASQLQSISAISTSDIWAVGYGGLVGSSSYQSLTEHWNGSSWSVVASPNASSSPTFFNSVAADGSRDVWAVGYYSVPSPIYRLPVIEHWNGFNWSISPTPNPGTYSALIGVIAVSPRYVMAVGALTTTISPSQSVTQVLIEQYNPLLTIRCR